RFIDIAISRLLRAVPSDGVLRDADLYCNLPDTPLCDNVLPVVQGVDNHALTSSTSSSVKPRCLSALYSDGKNGSGASLNSVRFRYLFLPISRSVVSSAVRLLDCGGVLSALRLPHPRLTR